MAASASDPLVGTTHGGFAIEARLHRGLGASIYRARQVDVGGRLVALKVMNAVEQRLLLDGKQETSPLWREARYSKVAKDKVFVPVFHTGQLADGRYYAAMEYIEGPTLREELDEVGALPWEHAFRLIGELVWALARLHEARVIHADLKPENLMLRQGSDGHRHVRLIDFGRAQPADDIDRSTLALDPELLGTPRYMAPEQAARQPLTFASDVYAVGAVLYELVTGVAALDIEPSGPRDCIEWLVSTRPVPVHPLPELAPDAPDALAELVARCLHRDPDARPVDGNALKVAYTEAMVKAEAERPRRFRRIVRGLRKLLGGD